MNRREFLAGVAALALAPEALARSLGGTAVALVTADLESHVVAVELDTGRVLRRIRTAPGPRSIETVGNDALVAHTEHGALTVIDGATLRVREVVHGLGEPRYAAASRDGRHAFVTDSAGGALVVVDVRRGLVVARLALGGAPRHLSLEPSSDVLWAVLGNTAERIAVVDVSRPARPRLVRTFAPPFLAHDVGFGPGRVWVTAGAARRLAVYDARGRVRLLRADAAPQHVTFLGGLAFVASGDSGTLRLHDARTGRWLRTTPLPLGSYNVQRSAYVARVVSPSLGDGTLCVADRRGRIVRRRRVARSSHDSCVVVTA